MPDNLSILSAHLTAEYREVDFGGYDESKKGETLRVWVNAPGVVESWIGGAPHTVTEETDAEGKPRRVTHYEQEPPGREYARRRKVVSLLYQLAPDAVSTLDDNLLAFLFTEGIRLYQEYHQGLRKNSNGG